MREYELVTLEDFRRTVHYDVTYLRSPPILFGRRKIIWSLLLVNVFTCCYGTKGN